jgi:hypothetical protein
MLYQDLKLYINEYERETQLVEVLYQAALERLDVPRQDLNKLDETIHVKYVIKSFLVHWGAMTRVVERKKVNWHSLTKRLKGLEAVFNKLRMLKFMDANFVDPAISSSIAKIWESIGKLKYLGGPTCTSKIIHLINPEIFVMWDNQIIANYHKYYRHVTPNAKGYIVFLDRLKSRVEKAIEVEARKQNVPAKSVRIDFIQFAKRKKKTIAKLLDEFNEYCPMSNL